MEYFVRVVMEKCEEPKGLNESVFPSYEIFESQQGATVFEIPLPRALDSNEANEYANKLANYMFSEGYDDFDIYIDTDEVEEADEITLDGNDFFEEFGVLGFVEDDPMWEAEYQGRTVKLNKPVRSSDGPKKFHVYVKNPKGNVVKVNFGDPDMEIKADDPDARRSFRARHNCDNPGPKHKARYWSCKKW